MSALDDVLNTMSVCSGPCRGRNQKEAREELELLRDTSFDWAASRLHGQPYNKEYGIPGSQWCDECTSMFHAHACRVRDILRTDPERARKMGLGWAL